MMRRSVAAFMLLVAACSTGADDTPGDTSTSAASTQTVGGDTGVTAGAPGLPPGFTARTDRPQNQISEAQYSVQGGQWEVTTGPAHIIYRDTDSASGTYTVSASFNLLQRPQHPEAFGIIIGGRDLQGDGQTYTYFLVRPTGDLSVKVREGGKTRDVLAWQPSTDVPKADSSGQASYDLGVQVTADAVRFLVNGKQAASVSKAGLPVDGVAGLRINHNLRLRVSPPSVTRS